MNPNQFYGQASGQGQSSGQPQQGQGLNMFNNVQQMLSARSGSPHLPHQAMPNQTSSPQLQPQLGQFRQMQPHEQATQPLPQYPAQPRLPISNVAQMPNRQMGVNMQPYQAGSQLQGQGAIQWPPQSQPTGANMQGLQALQQAMQAQQGAVPTTTSQQAAVLQQFNNMKPEQKAIYMQMLRQKQAQQQQQQAQQSGTSQPQQPQQAYQLSPQMRPVGSSPQPGASPAPITLAAAQQLKRQLSSQGPSGGALPAPMTPPTLASTFSVSPQPSAAQLPRHPSATPQQAYGLSTPRSTTPQPAQASTSRTPATFDPRQFSTPPPTSASAAASPAAPTGLQPQNLASLRRPSTDSTASVQSAGTPAASPSRTGAPRSSPPVSSPAPTPPLSSAPMVPHVGIGPNVPSAKAPAKPRPRKQPKKDVAPPPPPVLFSVVQPTKRDPVPAQPTHRPAPPSTPQQPRPAQPGFTAAQNQAALDRARQRDQHAERDRQREAERKAPPPAVELTRRKRETDMRGSMRNDISRLMYAAGDVAEPDVDTVDFMEDMVVEFLADLCRPVKPIRSTPQAAHQPVPLTNAVVRHRLASHPSLRKYLERFDIMTHMSGELAASRRLVQSNENLQDAIATVDKEYLGIDEDRPAARRGRPRRQDQTDGRKGPKVGRSRIDEVTGEVRPKRKPGPRKGWKTELAPDDPRRQKRNWRKQRQSSSVVPPKPE